MASTGARPAPRAWQRSRRCICCHALRYCAPSARATSGRRAPRIRRSSYPGETYGTTSRDVSS